LLRPRPGRVSISGQDIRGRPVGEVARRVGYLFQNPDHQIFAPTVREEIAFGLRNLGFSAAETKLRMEETLALFGLEAYADRPPAVLGYGLRRQVALASLVALRPPILILDEPTTGLDGANTALLMDHLHALHRARHTILLITHDMRLVAAHAECVLVLHQGRLLAQGATQEVFAQPELLGRVSISPPPVTRLSHKLRRWGMKGNSLTVEGFHREVISLLSSQDGGGR
jgi:energy-coupling factor transport system ATP-binding protein